MYRSYLVLDILWSLLASSKSTITLVIYEHWASVHLLLAVASCSKHYWQLAYSLLEKDNKRTHKCPGCKIPHSNHTFGVPGPHCQGTTGLPSTESLNIPALSELPGAPNGNKAADNQVGKTAFEVQDSEVGKCVLMHSWIPRMSTRDSAPLNTTGMKWILDRAVQIPAQCFLMLATFKPRDFTDVCT